MADEVDLGPPVGVRRQVGGELLYPVLAAHGDSGGDGLPDGVVGLHLGGGAQGDLIRVPAGGLGRGGNVGLYLIDVLLNGHNRFPQWSTF